MGQRLQLQTLLEEKLGSRNVYFQPPASIQMKYPAIVYERGTMDIKHADNNPYRHTKRYSVTVIYSDADSELPDIIASLPSVSHSRHFKANNLYHDVFDIYF